MEEEDQRHEVCAVVQVPRLYLTDWVGAASVNEANILGITHILSVMTDEEYAQYGPDETQGVELRHLKIKDEASVDLAHHLDAEYDWMDGALANSGSVIVHCQQGISRSAALVIAYLMRKKKLGYDEALKLVKQSRAIVHVNAGFEAQLRARKLEARSTIGKDMQATHPKGAVNEITTIGIIDFVEAKKYDN